MVKPKQKNSDIVTSPENPLNIVNSDLSEEDSWVIVKKQRISILIPPLPSTDPSTSVLDPEQAKLPEVRHSHLIDTTTSVPYETPPEFYPPEGNIVPTREVTPPPSKPSPKKKNNEEKTAFHKEKSRGVRKGSFHLNTMASKFRDKMMKSSNLERRIVRAGGVDKWLSSLGLEKFTRIFRGKKIGKFQLANLSMKKLKDMGAHAVGPRRKLIHAIECAILF